MKYFKIIEKTALFMAGKLACVAILIAFLSIPIYSEPIAHSYVSNVYDQLVRLGDDEDLWSYIQIGRLSAGDKHKINISELTDGTYEVIAVCDQDCSDIDMCVRGGDSDVEYSEYQSSECDKDATSLAIRHADATNNRMSVGVDMLDCDDGYCYYGVALYREQ